MSGAVATGIATAVGSAVAGALVTQVMAPSKDVPKVQMPAAAPAPPGSQAAAMPDQRAARAGNQPATAGTNAGTLLTGTKPPDALQLGKNTLLGS
jgi:hypothetical protein